MVSPSLVDNTPVLTPHEGTTESGGEVPTVTDNAFDLGVIDSKLLGISFAPTNDISSANGQLTFGGVDESLFNAPLTTVCVPTSSDSRSFVDAYRCDLQPDHEHISR